MILSSQRRIVSKMLRACSLSLLITEYSREVTKDVLLSSASSSKSSVRSDMDGGYVAREDQSEEAEQARHHSNLRRDSQPVGSNGSQTLWDFDGWGCHRLREESKAPIR